MSEFVSVEFTRPPVSFFFGSDLRGCSVKVCVQGERFWVDVTGAKGDMVGGRVANEIVGDAPLREGDLVVFNRHYIFDVFDGWPF